MRADQASNGFLIINILSLTRTFTQPTLKLIPMTDLKTFLLFLLARHVITIELDCVFEVRVGGYDCRTTSNLKEANLTITSTNGVHQQNKNDSDVEVLLVPGGTTGFLPVDTCLFFPAMKKFEVYANKLTEVARNHFSGCQNVKEVKIAYNLIEKLPEDVFYDMPSLVSLKMNKNRIQVLPKNLFAKNPKLVEIILDNNKLTSIQAALPTAARFINLKSNPCIDESYPDGLHSMNLLLYEVLVKCKIPPLEKENSDLQVKISELERDIVNETVVIEEFKEEKLEVSKNASDSCQLKIQAKDTMMELLRNNLSRVKAEYVSVKSVQDKCKANLNRVTIRVIEQSHEIELLTSNHSSAQNKIEELYTEIIDLKQNVSDASSQVFETTAQLAQCNSEKLNVNETLQMLILNLSAANTQNEARKLKIADLESDIARTASEYKVTVEELQSELMKALDDSILSKSQNDELSMKMFELESNSSEAAENCSFDVHTITREAEALKAETSTTSYKVLIGLLLVGWIASIICYLKNGNRRRYDDHMGMKVLE